MGGSPHAPLAGHHVQGCSGRARLRPSPSDESPIDPRTDEALLDDALVEGVGTPTLG